MAATDTSPISMIPQPNVLGPALDWTKYLVGSKEGTSGTTTQTGDTAGLSEVLAQQLDPATLQNLVNLLFNNAAMTVPSLIAANANNTGTRVGGNQMLGQSLAKMNTDLATQIAQAAVQQQANASQTAGRIAEANKSSTVNQTKETKPGKSKAPLALIAGGLALNKLDKIPGYDTAKEKISNFFDSGPTIQPTPDINSIPVSDFGMDVAPLAASDVTSNLLDNSAAAGFAGDAFGNEPTFGPDDFEASVGGEAAVDTGGGFIDDILGGDLGFDDLFADGGKVPGRTRVDYADGGLVIGTTTINGTIPPKAGKDKKLPIVPPGSLGATRGFTGEESAEEEKENSGYADGGQIRNKPNFGDSAVAAPQKTAALNIPMQQAALARQPGKKPSSATEVEGEAAGGGGGTDAPTFSGLDTGKGISAGQLASLGLAFGFPGIGTGINAGVSMATGQGILGNIVDVLASIATTVASLANPSSIEGTVSESENAADDLDADLGMSMDTGTAADADDSAAGEGMGSADAGTDSSASDAGTGGDAGGDAGGAAGGDAGGGDSGGGDGGGGDGGGGDGGFEKGGEIVANNVSQLHGVDRKVIHVTPGEYVLPVDVVDYLGSDNLDELIAALHTPVKNVNTQTGTYG